LVLGIVIIPNLSFSQKNNQIGFQIGLTHFYFDDSGLFNKNIEGKSKLSLGEHFHESWGINYPRRLFEKSRIGLEVDFINTFYRDKENYVPGLVVEDRKWMTFRLFYSRSQQLRKRFSINYGVGLNYRHGHEGLGLAQIPAEQGGPFFNSCMSVMIWRRDIGMNIFGSIQYDLNETFFVYSKLDFLGILYVHDKEGQRRMRNVYDVPQYPSRFDLSINFGIGFNF